MLKVRVDNHEEISVFLRDEKDTFFNAIIDAIGKGWANHLDRVPVAEFLINDTETVIAIDIEEDDWYESLHLALYHFEESEDYEKCGKLQNLIYEIYND